MKEQTRNTEVQINEEKIGKLPEKAFRIMIVNIIKHLKKSVYSDVVRKITREKQPHSKC